MKYKLPDEVKDELKKAAEVLYRFVLDMVVGSMLLIPFAIFAVVTHLVIEYAETFNHDPVFKGEMNMLERVEMCFHGIAIAWVLWKALLRFLKNLK
ncbi:hypothetical protein [Paraburkholderia youngii]|uniref:hypothetical protein n=1 Tax=Paraburkholderia youngii TaxID=2782701 RepID=UPI003D24EDAC